MSKLHYILPSGATPTVHPVRLGAAGAGYKTADEGKFIKLAAESRYDLCAAGDPIEGVIYAVEPATSGGFSIGGRIRDGMMNVIADGLQATPGTGTIAVGDYVVCGTVTALNTKLTSYAKVCKATVQPGAVPADLTAAGAQVKAALFAWRVMSLGTGAGAVGTGIVIERV